MPCGEEATQGSSRSVRRQRGRVRMTTDRTLHCGFCGKDRQNKQV